MTSLPIPEIAAWQLPKLQPAGKAPKWTAALPSLQRGAVWTPGKIELFWDSLFRGFPVGSLVVSEKLQNQQSTYGKLGGNEDPWPGVAKRHLLDGQQRANAIALGFFDAFADLHTDNPGESILWIDLAADAKSFAGGSSRQFLFRLTTRAHPWGFAKGDDASRLETWKMHEAIERENWHAPDTAPFERPTPRMLSPYEAKAPIPLAWLLAGILGEMTEETLRAHLRQRCGASDRAWAKFGAEHLANMEPSSLVRIGKAAQRALAIAIPILEVPQEAIVAATHQEEGSPEEVGAQHISNIEHLFQRLNNGGTPISPDDLRYSMIKAYWPGIEQTIDAIKPLPMHASRLALLGARAARVPLPVLPEALPGELSVGALRAMATDRQQVESCAQLKEYFGIPDHDDAPVSSGEKAPVTRIVGIIDRWLLHRGPNDYGLPPEIRTAIAQDSPEIYLLLMILARFVIEDRADAEKLRQPIVALATVLHWFSRDKRKTVRSVYARLRKVPANGHLDASFFAESLRAENASDEEGNGLHEMIHPSKLGDILQCPVGAVLEEGHLWQLVVARPAAGDEAEQARLHDSVWPVIWRIVYDTQLLIYAQRQAMAKYFGDYDKTDSALWDGHNRPWDFDHLLVENSFRLRKTQKEPAVRFREACQLWGGTIGNFHILPFGDNRARKDKSAKDVFRDPEDLDPMLLIRGELDAFSLSQDDVRGNEPAVQRFVSATHRRILAIYSEWFESLGVAALLGQEPADENEGAPLEATSHEMNMM